MSEKTDALAEKAPDDTSADAKAGEQLVPTTIGGRQPPPVAFDEIDAATEKRVVRKLDRRLLPLVSLLYLVAFLDRSNIGNAHTAGMDADLGLSDDHYQWLLTIFYIPYALFEGFCIMWKIVPPHIWCGITVLVWGLASSLQAAAFNFEGLMACRWFLATAEAGFTPGVPYLLSFFYRRHEIGFRCGIFVSMAPLATTFAGALAYAITSGHDLAIANWRLLFLVEGLPTIILAAVAYFMLPDSTDTASFLTAEEKDVARSRSLLQSGKTGSERLGGIESRDILAALRLPQTYAFPLMLFSLNVPFSALPVFLPTVLKGLGWTAMKAQGMSAPPYFVAFLVCIATTYLADRMQQRGTIIIILSLIGALGYVVLALAKSVSVRYTACFVASAGMFPAIANTISWCINNQGSDTKRGFGTVVMQGIAQTGPILGTRLFPAAEGPFYVKGMAICAAFMFFNAIVATALRVWLARQNSRLDREEGGSGAAVKDIRTAPENDDMVGYRYIL